MAKRLTGRDGNLAQATVGNEIIGDGSAAIPSDGYYLVTGVATSSSTLPAGIQTGYLAYLTTAITPATGDNVRPITLTSMCYVQNGSLEFARDELETTTLCDSVKTYQAGFTDVTGSFDGIAEAGNEAVRSIIAKFVDTVELANNNGAATITTANTDIFYLQLEINKEGAVNEPSEFYFMPITITGSSAGVDQASAQTFTASFRVTSDGTNNIRPAFYSREVA